LTAIEFYANIRLSSDFFNVFGIGGAMRISLISGWRIFVLAVIFGLTGSPALPKDPPADLCTLLTPAQLQKTLNQPFGAPEESRAPAPFRGQVAGNHCEYPAQSGPKTASVKVVFIAYADSSEDLARQNFDKLAMWFSPESKPAVGDSAYMDSKGAIHVLKGRVRYYIAIEPHGTSKMTPYVPWATPSGTNSPAKTKVLTDLASAVAQEL
jgi:hypothetical protein